MKLRLEFDIDKSEDVAKLQQVIAALAGTGVEPKVDYDVFTGEQLTGTRIAEQAAASVGSAVNFGSGIVIPDSTGSDTEEMSPDEERHYANVDKALARTKEIYALSVTKLKLPPAIENPLVSNDVATIGDLMKLSKYDVMQFKRMGETRFHVLQKTLAAAPFYLTFPVKK